MILCVTLGVRLFRELPYKFDGTFTFNELQIVCTVIACSVFLFFRSLYKVTGGILRIKLKKKCHLRLFNF